MASFRKVHSKMTVIFLLWFGLWLWLWNWLGLNNRFRYFWLNNNKLWLKFRTYLIFKILFIFQSELIVCLALLISCELEHQSIQVVRVVHLFSFRNLIHSCVWISLDIHSNPSVDFLKICDLFSEVELFLLLLLFPLRSHFSGEIFGGLGVSLVEHLKQ